MGRRVFVTNIPMHAYVEGWVEVPDDTTEETLHDRVAEALRTSPRIRATTAFQGSVPVSDMDLDETLLDKWEFTMPMEKT